MPDNPADVKVDKSEGFAKNYNFSYPKLIHNESYSINEICSLAKRCTTNINIQMVNEASKSNCAKVVKQPYLPRPIFIKIGHT